MGKRKKRWTPEEICALLAGVTKYGTGKWKEILTDQQFSHTLIDRSNVDLKDKWRNLCCNVSNNVVVPPQSSPNKQTCFSQTFRMVTATTSKWLCQIIMILAIVVVLGLTIQTYWKWKQSHVLSVMSLWLKICYMILRKLVMMWNDLKGLFIRAWRFYKWFESLNICYIILRKLVLIWKDLDIFFNGVWWFYNWLENFNRNVSYFIHV